MSMPVPGDVPPQAGDEVSREQVVRNTTPENIRKFFDPDTYRMGQPVGEAVQHEVTPVLRHTTPQNIRKFFNPDTYRAQKRPGGEVHEAHPAAKARMSKEALLEKFKLAASLHGFELGDLMVTCLRRLLACCVCWLNLP